MAETVKKQMKEALDNILKIAEKKIRDDLSNGKNVKICFDAYNFWQQEERASVDYIFDIYNDDNLKYLVNRGMITAAGIFKTINNGTQFSTFEGETDKGINDVSMDKLIDVLSYNAIDYMSYAVAYVGRFESDSPYARIYEEYITNYFDLV